MFRYDFYCVGSSFPKKASDADLDLFFTEHRFNFPKIFSRDNLIFWSLKISSLYFFKKR